MSSAGRHLTVMVQRDGAVAVHTRRITLWQLRLGIGLAVALLLGGGISLLFYGPIVRAALRVPGLEREVARLRSENARIQELSAALDSVEAGYAQVRRMMGADIVAERGATAAPLPIAAPVYARPTAAPPRYAGGAGTPQYWPLDESGYITRGQTGGEGRDEAHPGVDVAVPMGSVVRASAGGTVRESGKDQEYGLYVLLDHTDGYQSMYGHLSRAIVRSGAPVAPGEVIGLTGNSGRSTAPHLHFEIRRNGGSLDPLTMVKERR